MGNSCNTHRKKNIIPFNNSMPQNALSQITHTQILKGILSTIPNTDILFFPITYRCAKLLSYIPLQKKVFNRPF